MGRIIDIEGEKITIGNNDGSMFEVERSNCNFEPTLGDEVEIFSSDTKVIVTKITAPSSNSNAAPNPSNNITVTLPGYFGKTRVNKVIYCFFALFFGCVGLHKLCERKFGQFFLSFIFCWTLIPFIISIFNFFDALFEPSDENGDIFV